MDADERGWVKGCPVLGSSFLVLRSFAACGGGLEGKSFDRRWTRIFGMSQMTSRKQLHEVGSDRMGWHRIPPT